MILPLAALRTAGLIQLSLVCASYEDRSRALFNDTAPRATPRALIRLFAGLTCMKAHGSCNDTLSQGLRAPALLSHVFRHSWKTGSICCNTAPGAEMSHVVIPRKASMI